VLSPYMPEAGHEYCELLSPDRRTPSRRGFVYRRPSPLARDYLHELERFPHAPKRRSGRSTRRPVVGLFKSAAPAPGLIELREAACQVRGDASQIRAVPLNLAAAAAETAGQDGDADVLERPNRCFHKTGRRNRAPRSKSTRRNSTITHHRAGVAKGQRPKTLGL